MIETPLLGVPLRHSLRGRPILSWSVRRGAAPRSRIPGCGTWFRHPLVAPGSLLRCRSRSWGFEDVPGGDSSRLANRQTTASGLPTDRGLWAQGAKISREMPGTCSRFRSGQAEARRRRFLLHVFRWRSNAGRALERAWPCSHPIAILSIPPSPTVGSWKPAAPGDNVRPRDWRWDHNHPGGKKIQPPGEQDVQKGGNANRHVPLGKDAQSPAS